MNFSLSRDSCDNSLRSLLARTLNGIFRGPVSSSQHGLTTSDRHCLGRSDAEMHERIAGAAPELSLQAAATGAAAPANNENVERSEGETDALADRAADSVIRSSGITIRSTASAGRSPTLGGGPVMIGRAMDSAGARGTPVSSVSM